MKNTDDVIDLLSLAIKLDWRRVLLAACNEDVGKGNLLNAILCEGKILVLLHLINGLCVTKKYGVDSYESINHDMLQAHSMFLHKNDIDLLFIESSSLIETVTLLINNKNNDKAAAYLLCLCNENQGLLILSACFNLANIIKRICIPAGLMDEECIFSLTPLMIAVRYGCIDVVKALLVAGANPNLRRKLEGGHSNNDFNIGGRTALEIATTFDYKKISKLLVRHGAKPF